MRPLPHDLGAETVVLSAVLWGDRTAEQLRLRASWFVSPEHSWLWAALTALEKLRPAYDYELRLAILLRLMSDLCAKTERYWHCRLLQISSYGGDPERCAAAIRARARERAVLKRMGRVAADLLDGDAPDWHLVLDTVAGLLRMRADHRRQELLEALDGAAAGADGG